MLGILSNWYKSITLRLEHSGSFHPMSRDFQIFLSFHLHYTSILNTASFLETIWQTWSFEQLGNLIVLNFWLWFEYHFFENPFPLPLLFFPSPRRLRLRIARIFFSRSWAMTTAVMLLTMRKRRKKKGGRWWEDGVGSRWWLENFWQYSYVMIIIMIWCLCFIFWQLVWFREHHWIN